MRLKPTLCVLYAVLISYYLCLLPNSLHAFDTHNSRAACLNNFLPSMTSIKILHAFDTHIMCSACPTNVISSILSP